jgi:GMP synthase (glutamine-hydrolysing)
MTTRLLLIQARDPADPLAQHERACIRRRLGGLDVRMQARNALGDLAETNWLDDIDALVIGGSGNFSVNHELSQRWVEPLRTLLDVVLSRSLPTFGICFGHQLLGLHLGSKVETHAHLEEVGTISLEVTEEGAKTGPFAGLSSKFFAHTGHSDHVVTLPAGVDLIVRGDRVEMQGFRVRGAPVFTTQFHPDLEGREARERYLSVKGGEETTTDPDILRKADAFRTEGHDEAAGLLARFVEHVARPHI